jgi:integrase/recombinase XerD
MTNSPTGLPLILKRPNWPIIDQIAWDALFTEGDLLDGCGPCVRWSEGSRRKREQAYGHWLAFLSRRGPLGMPSDVTDRATLETVVAFIEKELTRCSVRTVYMHMEDLLFLLRAMAPRKDWDWLHRIVVRLRARSNLGELKPRAGVTAPQIYKWALTRMRQADAMNSVTDLQRATLYRDGLMVGLLIARPLRLRTFIAIELGRQLVARSDGFLLRFAPKDIKDKKAHEYAVPSELVEPLQRYLRFHRPNLLRKKSSQRLWITRRGGPFSYAGFQRQLAALTFREFGEALRPHAFRHIAATTIAIEDPEHVSIIADVLGHATLAMSQKHYNLARGIEANASYQEIMQSIRKAAEQRTRSRRRLESCRVKAASPDSWNVED